MDHLPRLIRGLTKEQARHYKLFAARTERQPDRIDIRFFDLLRKRKGEDAEEQFRSRHYPAEDKNAFYRLKNRLLEDVNKALTSLYYNEDDFIHALHMLGLYHHFSTRNRLPEAGYYLRRAERNAAAIEHHELLDIIYGEYIRLSHETLSINPEVYVQKRSANRKQLDAVRSIDDLLAVVTYRLKTTQNFAADKNPVVDLLKKTTDDFIRDRNLKNSPGLRFRIYHAVSQVLLQRHEYQSLETYLLRTYREFEKESLFNRNNHDTKLQMLTYIVNTLFKNQKQKQSLRWAATLKSAMDEFNGMLQDKYRFFYYNALVINYSVIDIPEAIRILEEIKNESGIRSNSYYHLFVYLNLAVLRFGQQEYKEMLRNLNKLYLLDGYRNADPSLQLKIITGELIARFDLEQYDVVEYKTTRLTKPFRALIQAEAHYPERECIELLRKMTRNPDLRKQPELAERIRRFIEWMRKNPDKDSQIIDYGNWLQLLLTKKGLNT